MNPNFKTWLVEEYGLQESAAISRAANISTIERYYGDIDALVKNGGAQNLLNELSYSKQDERNAVPQKHKVPIHGNIYNGSATLRQAVSRYIEFCIESRNSIEVLGKTTTVLENVIEQLEKEKNGFVYSTGVSLFTTLGIARLESVHTNFLKWLLEKGGKYPAILEYFVRSIVKKANNGEPKLEGLKLGVETLLSAENNAVQLNNNNGVTSEYTCYYYNKKGYDEKTASVDLVVDVMVNNSPLKIIIENKVCCDELNYQTKIYRAYFSGDDSEINEANKSVYKKNPTYKKGNHKGEPKKLRAYKGNENEYKLFVFLTPVDYDYDKKAKNLSEYFIKYTYQDLLEDVIFPSLEDEVFSPDEKVFLADYVGMLVKADRDKKVMAKESEESRRLMQFKAAFETYSFAESQKDTVSDKTQSAAFGQVANGAYELLDKIDADDQIRKVKRRVPGWKNRPHQINSKILAIFMELSSNGKNGVFVDMLQDEFETRYPEERGNFTKNYNQMRNNGYKNHGKVFYEDNEQTVWLWGPIRDFVIEVYSK